MKLFKLRQKPGNEQTTELVMDTELEPDSEALDSAQEPPTPAEAPAPAGGAVDPPSDGREAEPASEARPAAPHDDLFAELSAGAAEEPAAEDDELDPGLLDIFRDARNEVEEGNLAAQLDNIPIDDLLTEAIGIGQRLGISVRARPEVVAERETPEQPVAPALVEVPAALPEEAPDAPQEEPQAGEGE